MVELASTNEDSKEKCDCSQPIVMTTFFVCCFCCSFGCDIIDKIRSCCNRIRMTNNKDELSFTARSLTISNASNENRRLTSGNHTLKFKPGFLAIKDAEWKDQGWGRRQGRIFIGLERDGQLIKL